MRLAVKHETVYHFDPPARGVVQSHRLTPSIFDGQTALDWRVDVEGASRGAAFRDGAGDWVETISVLGPVEHLTVHVEGTVETSDLSGVLRGHRERVPPLAYLRETRATRADLALRELAEAAMAEDDDPLAKAHALMRAVRDAIAYTPGTTAPETTAAEALALGHGVCQDHSHAMIAAARSVDVPARYVSGYLHAGGSGAPEASHAWAELYVQNLGWVGFDASNGVCPDEHYIRLGSGFDAFDAAPIRGISLGNGEERLEVEVQVQQ